MNRKLFFAAFILVVSLASSCKRESKLIVGTWKYDSDPCATATTTYKDDDTWTSNDPCAESEYQNSNGNYSVDKDQLTVSDAAFPIPITVTIEDIDKSSMTLNVGGVKQKYTKVK